MKEEIKEALQEQRKEIIAEWKPCLDEILESLQDMYKQYCGDGHSFMSAGERASYILAKYNVKRFDEAGRITHYRNEKGKFIKVKEA